MTRNIEENGESMDVVISGITSPELAELERIKQVDAGKLLHPEAVIRAAENPENPLHIRFEWDNSKAGEKYRLAQARALIMCVKVQYPDREPIRYFPHVRSDGKGYREVREVMHVETLKKSYLHQVSADIDALIQKYQAFAEISGEIKTLGKVLAKINRKIGSETKKAT